MTKYQITNQETRYKQVPMTKLFKSLFNLPLLRGEISRDKITGITYVATLLVMVTHEKIL
jgi:hypothetical protein